MAGISLKHFHETKRVFYLRWNKRKKIFNEPAAMYVYYEIKIVILRF